jgi:hypothetical protein
MATKRTITYKDSFGTLHQVRVTEAVARAHWRLEKQDQRSDARWSFACTPFSAAGINEELVTHSNRPRTYDDKANRWQGPRQRVTLFLGDAIAFPPAVDLLGRCRACLNAPIPPYGYCYHCDRSGVDSQIPAVEPAELPKLPADDGLAGGVGKAQGKARFPEAKAAKRSRARGRRKG